MDSHSPAKILSMNLNHQKSTQSSLVIRGAIYEDFLGMIGRGNHLPPMKTSQPTNF
jgi:hypothetical protein